MGPTGSSDLTLMLLGRWPHKTERPLRGGAQRCDLNREKQLPFGAAKGLTQIMVKCGFDTKSDQAFDQAAMAGGFRFAVHRQTGGCDGLLVSHFECRDFGLGTKTIRSLSALIILLVGGSKSLRTLLTMAR